MASSEPGPNGSDTDVFGNLPRSRVQRRSAKRDRPERGAAAGADAEATAVEGTGRGSGATGKAPKRAGTGGARGRSGSASGGRKAGARAATTGAKAPAGTATAASAGAAEPGSTPAIPPAGYATPRDRDDPSLSGLALLTTAVEAIGELVVIGLTAASQALRAALRGLPRP